MAAPVRSMSAIGLRGSKGCWLLKGPPELNEDTTFPRSNNEWCKVMTFSKDGSLFAFCDGQRVRIISVLDNKLVSEIQKPRTNFMVFSPCNTLLATWELYATTKDNPQGTPNLHIWHVKTGQIVKALIQKKNQGWAPQWSADEGICARNVNNEIQFYEKNNFETIATKLHLQKVSDYAITPKGGEPYHVAAYVPGSKGQPSFVRVYRYPNFGGPTVALANKSFYKADRVEMLWNNKGNGLLVLTVTDSSADSYYGEQGLHFISTDGESCLVPRDKNGPVYSIEWNPNSTNFVVVYGCMPAKATLFNLKAEPIFDYGTGPRNVSYFNPQGNILVLAGFGNLRGNIEFWDVKNKKQISNPKAPDSTYFEWCPDGVHILTATTAPRLRVGNGLKVWHYTGSMLYEWNCDQGEELWEATWQRAPDGHFPAPYISYRPIEQGVMPEAQPEAKKSAYIPPHLRGKSEAELQSKPKYREAYEPPSDVRKAQQAQENMSKQALKNKKKRDARKARQAQDGEDVGEPAPGAAPVAQSADAASGDPDKDKRIRALKKKLQQIDKLKEQQAQGKQLEVNQVEKLKSEAGLLKELEQLSL